MVEEQWNQAKRECEWAAVEERQGERKGKKEQTSNGWQKRTQKEKYTTNMEKRQKSNEIWQEGNASGGGEGKARKEKGIKGVDFE